MENAAGRKGAAFAAVTVAAASVPVFGALSLVALVSAYAAAVAAIGSPVRYAYFIPGSALALAVVGALGGSISTVALYAGTIGAALVCGAVLGAYLKRKKSAGAQAMAVGVTLALIAIAAAGVTVAVSFGSLSAAYDALYSALVSDVSSALKVFDDAIARYTASDPSSAAALDLASYYGASPEELARSVMLSLPGLAAGAAFVFGWLSEILARPMLALCGRRDLITGERRIAVPVWFAAIYLVLRIVTYFRAGDTAFAVCAANVLTAFTPAMICVGAGSLIDLVRSVRSVFTVMVVVMFALSAFIMPSMAILVLSTAGAIGTIVRYVRNRPPKDS